jgi:Bacteriocin-protection, YdeI or OmpD-Associated/Domain of unknown function (DUF1905)
MAKKSKTGTAKTKTSKSETKVKFKTTLLRAGKTATGIGVPVEVVESFNAGKKVPVKVTINGYTYQNTVAIYGGRFFIGVSAEHRKGAGIEGGDKIDVTLERDPEPRVVEVPPDFAKALKQNPAAMRNFETLSYSNKQGLVLPIRGAKTEETRKRRIEKAILILKS